MGRLILQAICAVGILLAGYAVFVSMTAAVVLQGSPAEPRADPGFPDDCLPVEGCGVSVDPLDPATRIAWSRSLEGCGLAVTDGTFNPTAYPFWKPRKLAEQDICLSTVAGMLGDWRSVAAWMRATGFTADGGVRLVPIGSDRRYHVSGHLIGTRAQTGLPQIRGTLRNRARDEHHGPVKMTVSLDPDGKVGVVTLHPVR
ncbi:hypothetical protein [Jannaschia donghaensis]|uniref:Uncharacterized protein n=1 Tax=Jannaschia donghaensis TaxID=420998 RepID=A0A0M6YF47_9RHOB|nr:hypothetical protein [Jannaschia donghaensis]CTQ48379.1 hypothetical protein JDO7802_00381 [Jannaschia donghaensis]